MSIGGGVTDDPRVGGVGEGHGGDNQTHLPPGDTEAAPGTNAPNELSDEESLGEEDDGESLDDEDEDEEGWIVDSGSDEDDFEFDEDEDDEFDEDEPSDFDDDQMHFEIEGLLEGDVDVHGEILNGTGDLDDVAARVVARRLASQQGAQQNDPEERGCYLLPDGDSIPSSTGMNHRQGSDSVGAASPGRLLVTGVNDVRLLDADENSATRGTVLAATTKLSFDVYSVTYDADSGLVAACGAAGPDGEINLAVFKVAQGITDDIDGHNPVPDQTSAGTPKPKPEKSCAMFIKVAELGVGKTGRYHERDMLNCVRFGKMALPGGETMDDSGSKKSSKQKLKNVLLCASQDGHCYVYAIELDGFSDASGNYGNIDQLNQIAISPTLSDGGQGGRGARRRPRVDARLTLEVTIDLPTACNAAAASPDGRFCACVGDFENLHLEGGRGGYKKVPGLYIPEHRRLPIDGTPETENDPDPHNDPEGGMYVAWSGDSRYVAATTDSACVVAVWRVGLDVNSVTRIAYLSNHAHPCLPICFLPSDPNVLVWAERGGRVHAYDLRRAEIALKASYKEYLVKKDFVKDGMNLLYAKTQLQAIDMSPPRRRGDSDDPTMGLLGKDDVEKLTPAAVAAMSDTEKRDRLEANRLEAASVTSQMQAWPAPNELTNEDLVDINQLKTLRQMHRLTNEQVLLQGKSGARERGYVQTIRARVRGVFVTGVCAVTAPAPPNPMPGSPVFFGKLGPSSLQKRPPPHDLVFVAVPSGVLRFRAPTHWLPDINHRDFPKSFRNAARGFLICAEASSRNAQRARSGDQGGLSCDESSKETAAGSSKDSVAGSSKEPAAGSSSNTPSPGAVCLGDMPQEVLLRVLGLAAVPISDWIEIETDGLAARE